jgi:hypothetical protein
MVRGDPGGVFLHYSEPPVRLPGWPESVTTDEQGYFTLEGVGPETDLYLQVRDERFATQWLTLKTAKAGHAERQGGDAGRPAVLSLLPPRTLEGRLTAEDTGQPLADVSVVIKPTGEPPSPLPGLVEGRTDREGRFRIRPFPGQTYDMGFTRRPRCPTWLCPNV